MFDFKFFKKRKLEKMGYANSLSRKRSKKTDQPGNAKGKFVVLACFLLIWTVSIYSFSVAQNGVDFYPYIEGQVVEHDLYAKYDFSYVLTEGYNERLRLGIESVPLVFTINSKRVDRSVSRVNSLINLILTGEYSDYEKVNLFIRSLSLADRALLDHAFKQEGVRLYIKDRLLNKLSKGILAEDAVIPETKSERFSTIDYNSRICDYPIDALKTPKVITKDIIDGLVLAYADLSPAQMVIKTAIEELIEPNLVYNGSATALAQAESVKNVTTVLVSVDRGDCILEKGKNVTAERLNIWKAYEESLRTTDIPSRQFELSRFVIFSFIVTLMIFFLARYNRYKVWSDPQLLALFSSAIATNIILIVTTHQIFIFLVTSLRADLNYPYFIFLFLPCMLSSMLCSLLIDSRSAYLAGVLVSFLVGLIYNIDFHILLSVFFISAASGLLVTKARSGVDIMKASIYTVLVGVFIVSVNMAIHHFPSTAYLYLLGFGVLSFLTIYLMIMILLPVFEYVFGQTSNLSLLALCDLNHPLLQELQMKAPGSYHHSLVVATIAEHAAKAIGANPLLARVCSYFHDIGKMSKSEYFTENNSDSNSIHHDLKARMSTIVIQNHVKEGVNLALRYKLKKPIIEAIEQHHGKSLVSFFYQLAKGQTEDKYVVEDLEFRYRGPCPSRKEIVIIAIADPCEAASRSLKKPSFNSIQSLVSSIITSRFEEGMFVAADITLVELEAIKVSIITTLCNMLHTRVSYPKDSAELAKMVAKDEVETVVKDNK